MERRLGRYAEVVFALLRVIAGLMFAMHGAQKLFGMFGGKVVTDVPKMLVAGVIEFGGGILIALGLLGSFAAFLASGLMAFAYFMSHHPQGFWPVMNKGELAALYCWLFLYIACRGSGPYSLDALLSKRRR
jgi:putative oxidoreductase